MSRLSSKLTAKTVAGLKEQGRYNDGDGLYLYVKKGGSKTWVFRHKIDGRLKEYGLGSIKTVSLLEAREKARAYKKMLVHGEDPRKSKKSEKLYFGEFANAYMQEKSKEYQNQKHIDQWFMTVNVYCKSLANVELQAIDTKMIVDILNPIWTKIPETARRLRGRLEAILASAIAQGLRSGPNPAILKNHLDKILPKMPKLSRGHHKALPFSQLPDFIVTLRNETSISALALEFLILTASRTGEVIGCRWDEIDESAQLWTIPKERMKAKREHRIPLTPRAKEIIKALGENKTSQYVFPGQSGKMPMSNMAMAQLLKRLDIPATVHGMRSCFRDWAGEVTEYPRELAEQALAHVVGDETERAYRRGDALEKRRIMMNEWENYLNSKII